MTHRDELEALRARVETQEQELRDARAELDVLRAAVHRQASITAGASADGGAPSGAMGFGPGVFGASASPEAPGPSGLRPSTQRQIGTLMILTSLLVGSLLAGSTLCRGRGERLRDGLPRPAYGGVPAPAPVTEGPAWSPFVRFGHVVGAADPAVVADGTACSVEVAPADGGWELDCRIVVRCGDHVLYGESPMTGYAACGVVPSYVVDARTSDADGDPAMTLDLAAGTVTVEERAGLVRQRVEIALDPLGAASAI